jgi:hypothetical protein
MNSRGDWACGSDKLRRLIKMNTSDTPAFSPTLNMQIDNAATGYDALSGKAQDSVVRKYATRTAANLRSIVERRFRRMSEAHDRIRAELLSAHSSQVK